MHETLLSKEEKIVAEDLGDYFRIPPDNRDLNYNKFFSEGKNIDSFKEFNSENTERLSKSDLINLLNSIGYSNNVKTK